MFMIAFNSMMALFLCMLIGFIAAKKKVITSDVLDGLNKFLLNVTFPFMMINTFNMELTPEIAELGPKVFIYGISFQLFLLLVSVLFIKLFKVKAVNAPIYQFLFVFGNVGFVGLPLASGVFGETGMLYATIICLTFNLICFTLGIILLDNKGKSTITIKSVMLTPVMVGMWIGLFIFLSQLVFPFTFEVDGVARRLPEFLTTTVALIAGITSPLAMIVVGASLAKTNILKVFTDYRMYVYSFARLIIAPILVFLVFRLFITDPIILTIITVFAGLPPATLGTILTETYGHDYVLTSELIFSSTLFSIVTIPILFLLFG